MTSAEFLDTAIRYYGRDGAQGLCEAVFEGVAIASEKHDVTWPIETVRLGFAEWGVFDNGIPLSPVIGLLDGYYGFGLMFNTSLSPARIARHARVATVHEVTHAAQYQEAWKRGELSDAEERTFSFAQNVFNEGVACWHEYDVDEPAFVGTPLDLRAADNIDMQTELRSIVSIGKSYEHEAFIQYLGGDATSPKKGYKVGLFLVDACIELGLVSPPELIKTSSEMIDQLISSVLRSMGSHE